MAGSMPWSSPPSPAPMTDSNELLQRIDQNTQQIFHWVRLGFVVVIVLLVLVVIGF
jgi:hypothetical protein